MSDGVALLHHFVNREALFRQCPSWARLNAFATVSAIPRLRPIVFQVADNPGVDTAHCDLPHIRSFKLGAHSDASRAEDATIVVENKTGMRHIDGQARIVIGVAHMRDSERLSQGLKFAMAVRYADRANMIPFHEEELDRHLAV